MDIEAKLQNERKRLNTELRHLAWYHGKISRNLAEMHLNKIKKNGMFLVRQSMMCPMEFVLSLIYEEKCYHYMIENVGDDNFFRMPKGEQHEGLDTLVKYHSKQKHGLPTNLETPCSGANLPPAYVLTTGCTNILHKAIEEGKKSFVKAIIANKKQIDIDWKNDSGSTALHLACIRGEVDVVRWLLFIGSARVDILDKDGFTPLQRACQFNHSAIIKLLIEEGKANVQKAHRKSHNVALHEAAINGCTAAVKTLLSCHVPAWPRNIKQLTPYDLAVKFSHHGVAKLLDEYKPPSPKTKKEYWFHGDLTRDKAADLLRDKPNGYFLVRSSSNDKHALSMCYKNDVHHFRINSYMDRAFYLMEGPLLSSLELFVEHYSRYKDGLPHLLTYAVDKDGITRSIDSGEIIERVAVDPEITESEQHINLWVPPRIKSERGKEFFEIKLEDLEIGVEIGQGEYGSVFRGKWKTMNADGEPEWHNVAIKSLNQSDVKTCLDSFLTEAKIMLNFNHLCIVKLIGICNGPPMMLIQELLPSGSLIDFLLDYPDRIDMNTDTCRWAMQIAHGMDYLESKKFVHRDLAARNVLLRDKFQAKVGDFGLSRAIDENRDYYRATKGGRWPVKWYAPECVYYGKFSHHSDVWSYGVTLWEMYSLGKQPYEDKTGGEVVQMIESGYRLECPALCPSNIFNLMLRCWQYNPADRPTFKSLHQFFSSTFTYTNVQLS